ncbi:MAG: DUF6798 domain-containing protein [Planctomycetota bacterium]
MTVRTFSKRGGIEMGGNPGQKSWANGFGPDWVGVFLVFFLVAGGGVPGVNESHYWTKGAHFWDAGFGRGDLFLESGNAHWLFYATWGALTQFFELPVAVWGARISLWLALAAGWTWMMRGALLPAGGSCAEVQGEKVPNSDSTAASGANASGLPWVATVTSLVWLAGMHWGHWAGEWVVGGAESKVVAYAAIFFAFGFFFRGQWTRGWASLGIAAAFHVVTGLWVIVCALLLVLWDSQNTAVPSGTTRRESQQDRIGNGWNRHGWGLGWACLGIVVGALPPLWIDWGAPSAATAEAAATQVYGRLGHHLSPSKFSMARWESFGLLLTIGLAVLGILSRSVTDSDEKCAERQDSETGGKLGVAGSAPGPRWEWPFGLRWLVGNALIALAIAGIGLLIDYGIGGIDRIWSAKLLKYYWFRWNDVSLPLAIAAGFSALAYGVVHYRDGAVSARIASWSILGIVGIGFLATRYWEQSLEWIPFGDRARFLSKQDDEVEQRRQYRDWLEVCAWIRQNTEPDGLWLTPKNQQSFKWHARRGELASLKDMPQDAVSVVEWSKRLDDAYKVDETIGLLPWTDQQLWMLHEKYGIRYVLMDRRVEGQRPPLLPMLFPTGSSENETFSVFAFPEGLWVDPKMQSRSDVSRFGGAIRREEIANEAAQGPNP